MGTLADKLSYLDGTKTAIKNAIIAKGVDVEDVDTFRAYADKIGEIEGGGGIPEYMMYAIVDDGATSVPNMSNAQNWFMSKVHIPSSVTQIGNYFVTRSAITEASGGGLGLTFGAGAFQGCTALTTIDLPSATTFGTNAFYSCTALTSADLPSATTFGNYAFQGCTVLTTVDLPSATTFGTYVFYGCALLVTVNLPLVTQFGGNAFQGCPALANIDLGNRSNVLTLSGAIRLQTDNLTVDSFLQVGNALVDNTGGDTKAIQVKTVAWGRLSTAQKAIFTNKNYTVNVS